MVPPSVFPPEITFLANFNDGLNAIGGKLHITPDTIIFKAHTLNIGNLSDRVFYIADISGYKKGFLSYMYIFFNDGTKIKLNIWKKNKLINELEKRRINIFTSHGTPVPPVFK